MPVTYCAVIHCSKYVTCTSNGKLSVWHDSSDGNSEQVEPVSVFNYINLIRVIHSSFMPCY